MDEPQCPKCGEPVYERKSPDGKVYYVCATKKCGPHNPLFPDEVKFREAGG